MAAWCLCFSWHHACAALLLLFLAASYQTLLYFLLLLSSMCYCYFQPVERSRKVISALSVLVTWFLIIRFLATYTGPMTAFDAAYADVIWGGASGNWRNTQMLLCWAVVATVWTERASPFYQIFGLFGAMSGSYLLIELEQQPSKRVPLHYAVCALLAFCCIFALPLATTALGLSWALWGLHVSLLAPKFLRFPVTVGRGALYTLLSLLACLCNLWAGRGIWANSDCRLSITVDAALCAALTLAHIHKRTGSGLALLVAGALMPLVSPGAVLGLFGAWEVHAYCEFVTWLQELGAEKARKKDVASDADAKWRVGTWMNLGFWKDTNHYDTACQQLAEVVGASAHLQPGDSVLDVGCGYGDSLFFFKAKFGVTSIVGLERNEAAARCFKPGGDGSVRLVLGDASRDIGPLKGKGKFQHGQFQKVVAVDSIYHCDKARFFAGCSRLLPRHGLVVVTDILLRPGAPPWLRPLLCALGLPWANHWPEAEYAERLMAASGLVLQEIRSLEPHVLRPWLPEAICRHLDYVLIRAELLEPPRRPTAAVIGSGLSGLVAAHCLGATHDVTIFEAKKVPGFAGGEVTLPTGGIVDIPLRMIEPHYWRNLVDLCAQLDVPLVDTHFTVSIYGKEGAELKTDLSLFRSVLGNISHYSSVLISAMRLDFTSTEPRETLLELVQRLDLATSNFYKTYVRRHLSWVLSCTYEMVDNYPAHLVLDFFRAIRGNYARQQGPTLRIDPSVKRLEDALLAGKSIRTNFPVPPFQGGRRVIDGVDYDSVVFATEAGVVTGLLPQPWAAVFGKFRYHESLIFVHRDPTLMPKERCHWRGINVCDDETGEACQITVWVNAFYGQDCLGGDVFETVNPIHRPEASLVIREVRMQRVVHDKESAGLQKEIAELQGREGFYFCGAYSVPGMGLLEQACLSGQRAADAVSRNCHTER